MASQSSQPATNHQVLSQIADRLDHHVRIVRQGRRVIVNRQVHLTTTLGPRVRSSRSTRCQYAHVAGSVNQDACSGLVSDSVVQKGIAVARLPSGRVGGVLQLSDLDLAHLEHRLHRPAGALGIGIVE